MAAYANDALAFCHSKVGDGYLAGGCRCEVPCPTQDCSGLPVAATRAAGLWIPCINSSGFARWAREAGTIISFDEAIHTPFALLIRGDNGGEDGDGPKGHVMPCVGDGLHTCEAMGRRYGICYGSVFGRNVARCMKVPGVIYAPKPPPIPIPKPKPGVERIVDFTHAKAAVKEMNHKGGTIFQIAFDIGRPVGACQATVHGPELGADGFWPWTLDATVRCQARGNLAVVMVHAPNWKPGNPLPIVDILAIPA